jgi:hypothetical protein
VTRPVERDDTGQAAAVGEREEGVEQALDLAVTALAAAEQALSTALVAETAAAEAAALAKVAHDAATVAHDYAATAALEE